MARKIIITAGMLWGSLFMLCLAFGRPAMAFFPLVGLYPGSIASGGAGYNSQLMTLWSLLFAVILGVVGFVAYRFRNVNASIAFLALLLVSGLVFVARGMAALDQLH